MIYHAKFQGLTAMLMHADDVEAQDLVVKWQQSPRNKSKAIKGDDRSPVWKWVTCLYHDDDGLITIPWANLTKSFAMAAKQVRLGSGRMAKSLKEFFAGATYSNIKFYCKEKSLVWDDFSKTILDDSLTYEDHKNLADKHGFDLFLKRAKLTQTSKHVRVRPKFNSWSFECDIDISDPAFAVSQDAVEEVLKIAGLRGLGDWRPSSPEGPGSFGIFALKELKEI